MRTTSTLEAYNGALGNNVVNRGHFFVFVHDIRSEELFKSREAKSLVESGGKTAKKRKVEWVERDKQIQQLNVALENKEITPMDYVRQLSWKNSGLTDQFLSFDCVGDLEEDSWDAEIGAEDDCSIDVTSTREISASSDSDTTDPVLCVLCKKNKKELCLIPCGHLSCSKCWESWVDAQNKENEKRYRSSRLRSKLDVLCPHDCNQIVTSNININF